MPSITNFELWKVEGPSDQGPIEMAKIRQDLRYDVKIPLPATGGNVLVEIRIINPRT